MARISKAEQALIPNVSLFMNGKLLETIDQDEVADRVYAAKQLMDKANATDDPTLKKSWNSLAGALLQMPKRREEIEKQVQDLRTKADLSWNAEYAKQVRRQADRIIEENPVAPRRQQALRRALRKAADEGQMACYDKDGNLVGVVDPAKVTRLIQPSAPAAKGDPAPAGQTELGTPKQPASAAAPAADSPEEVTKQRIRGVLTRRPV